MHDQATGKPVNCFCRFVSYAQPPCGEDRAITLRAWLVPRFHVLGVDRPQVENIFLQSNHIFKLNECFGRKEADIEDLFELEFYVQLVNKSYPELEQKPIRIDDLSLSEQRIVKKIENFYYENNIDNGKFNHFTPANYF